ncbi:MAG: hypothetical protein U9Q18_05410 [Caldisericota bacterium]|nr:hypothetical protein [Caldisericota bacterium]
MGLSFFKHEAKLSIALSSRLVDDELNQNLRILIIKITNIGNKTAVIKSIKIKVPRNEFETIPKFLSSESLPYELKEGEVCLAETSIKKLVQKLIDGKYSKKVKLLITVEDTDGKIHRPMASLMFDLDKLRGKYYIK